MGRLRPPEKPLKILTIDGGGLQAISTLLILNRLLKTIQERNNSESKPRPCDVFDVIAGIGAGGWLALFLGRFQMDITSCLTEWYSFVECISPKTKGQTFRRRLFHDAYFDPPSLARRVDDLAKLYGTGSSLIGESSPNARCKYVFVAAQRADSPGGYSLFRTYECPKDLPGLKPGPDDPSKFTISRAFAVTGAKAHFSPSRKEKVAGSGTIRFLDKDFQEPHSVTMLALEEIWTLFGDQVPLEVIVNIGPGQPTCADIKKIVPRFSFGITKGPIRRMSFPLADSKKLDSSRPGQQEKDRKYSLKKYIKREMESSLVSKSQALEADIRKELRGHYSDAELYFRLAPELSPPGTVQSDIRQAKRAREGTELYLQDESTISDIDSASDRLSTDSERTQKLAVSP